MSPEPHIGFASLGNGLAVYNRLKEINGDYQKVAHIASTRDVTFYENLPAVEADDIRYRALTSDPSSSSSQPENKVFHIPPIQDDFPDLLELIDELPDSVYQLLLDHSERSDSGDYREQRELQKRLNSMGYAIESGLDGQAYDLRKISEARKGDVETVEDMLRSYTPNHTAGMSM